jgi:hypothetical protein
MDLDDVVNLFTAEQVAEVVFNDGKSQRGKIEALLSGQLDSADVTEELATQSLQHLTRLAKTQKELRTTKARKRKLLEKPSQSVEGAAVFVSAKCRDSFHAGQFARLGVTRVDRRADATVFIVEALDEVSPKVTFVAGLVGGLIANPQYVKSGGKDGGTLGFFSAIQIKRMVYITEGFMILHPMVCTDLYEVLQGVVCRWTLASAEQVLLHVGPGVGRRDARQREVIALMTESELIAKDLALMCICMLYLYIYTF